MEPLVAGDEKLIRDDYARYSYAVLYDKRENKELVDITDWNYLALRKWIIHRINKQGWEPIGHEDIMDIDELLATYDLRIINTTALDVPISNVPVSKNNQNPSCPCYYLDNPCHSRCSCLNPMSSSGCNYCCSVGDPEQKREHARKLQNAITNGSVVEISFRKWKESLVAKRDALKEKEKDLDTSASPMGPIQAKALREEIWLLTYKVDTISELEDIINIKPITYAPYTTGPGY